MNFSEDFIIQTAKDYDLTVDEVKMVSQKYPDSKDFYRELENILENK